MLLLIGEKGLIFIKKIKMESVRDGIGVCCFLLVIKMVDGS